ncbi:DUF418 domain-containing protein [Nocardia sp. NPDC057030]|uniref:DUF418 domain-containing protein n=1 Tax=unclassified Nocardia TaxID=2637762 RepID=UPI00362A8C5E
MAHNGTPASMDAGIGPPVRAGAATGGEVAGTEGAVQAGARLLGVDLARGLAVLGMYAAHVGPDPGEGGFLGFVMELTHGRSSALFAFLAGFSILLITGRRAPKAGRAGRQARVRILIRAGILLVIGTALTATGTKVEVILAYYGMYFLLALPFARLRAGTLAAIAAVSAVVLPQLVFLVLTDLGWADAVNRFDPLAWLGSRGDPIGSGDGVVGLLFTGNYPALSWMPFVFAGMAVARLDLSDTVIRVRLASAGIGLAVLGYGGSALALHFVPGVTERPGIMYAPWWSDLADSPAGWRYQLGAMPHSETTLSIVANTGVALTVLIACLAVCDGSARLPRLAAPLLAVGSMSLTAYVFHVVAIAILGFDVLPAGSLPVLLGLSAIIMMFAYCWSRFFRRGPLEWLLHRATMVADRVR